jgi:hypothetical protein
MIILKVHEKGHFLEIPGMPPVNSPVHINITSMSIPLVAAYLKKAGIENYEIVADSRTGEQKIYKSEDFYPKPDKPNDQLKSYRKETNKRLDRIEKMIEKLAVREPDKSPKNEEQINRKLDLLAELIKEREVRIQTVDKIREKNTEPDIEELDSFIPQVDVEGATMKGRSSIRSEERDDSADESADILSRLSKKNRGG